MVKRNDYVGRHEETDFRVRHSAIYGVNADQHHDKEHAHDGADGSGTVAHSDTSGQTADDHHAESHAHDGADGSGTVAHADTTGQTTDDHHAQAHNHAGDGSGTVSHNNLANLGDDDHGAYLKGTGTTAHPARSLNTAFQPDAGRPVLVMYTVRITCDPGETGEVELFSDSGNPPAVMIGQVRLSAAASVGDVIEADYMLTYIVQPGDFVELETVNIAGTPAFSLERVTEVTL